ncbi:MAG: hypothetical protein RLZ72_505 [Actinomycetota bacterium]
MTGNSFVEGSTPNPYAPKAKAAKAKKLVHFGESLAMIIGSIAVALAGVWPGVIWFFGWWTEKYHWQPSPSDLMIFFFLIGPAALILVFYGAVTLIVGLFNWLSNKASLSRKLMSFGRGARIVGIFGAITALASLGFVVGVTAGELNHMAQNANLVNAVVKWWPPFYTVTSGFVLLAMLVGWIFTPRQSKLVDDREDVK